MHEPHRRSLVELLQHPGRDCRLYLRQSSNIPSKQKEPIELELHSAFSDAITYFLWELVGSPGFVRLEMSSGVTNKSPQKNLIRWESGVSEQGYIDKQHLDEIKQFFQGYLYNYSNPK